MSLNKLLFRFILLLILLGILAVAVLVAVAVAGVTVVAIALIASGEADVFDAVENDAQHFGFGLIHLGHRVVGLLAGGLVLAGDENAMVGVVGQQGGVVEDADGGGVEKNDVELLLEA